MLSPKAKWLVDALYNFFPISYSTKATRVTALPNMTNLCPPDVAQ